jgi:hypothetical protein
MQHHGVLPTGSSAKDSHTFALSRSRQPFTYDCPRQWRVDTDNGLDCDDDRCGIFVSSLTPKVQAILGKP